MTETVIRLTGPNAKGPVVDASMLRDLLDALVDAVQQAVRLRTDDRSRAPGFAPAWLTKAASFLVEFRDGSTQIALLASPLGDLVPEKFAQVDMFDPFSPAATCIDVFVEALDDALAGKLDSNRYKDWRRSDLRPVARRRNRRRLRRGHEQAVMSGSSIHCHPQLP